MDIVTMWYEQQLQLAAKPLPAPVPVAKVIGFGAVVLCSAALVYNGVVGGYFSGDVQPPLAKAETGFAQLPAPQLEREAELLPKITVPVTIVAKAPRRQPPKQHTVKTCRLSFTELYGSPVRICDVSRSPIRPGPKRNLASLTR